ncbi:AP-5 complex subunit beta-1-like [Hydractinia symbiolongicarpus]|uniref:AP-5 complex subunit beta-1-like n=1 Tax=Hydractinia symbiolongicarpus TaxID=13093 RepID=UPI00255045B9|nr:AP-5 complex subunit beta-1-like [Hydractinia symbiolongicarpus]
MENEEKYIKTTIIWERRLKKFSKHLEMSLLDVEFNKEMLFDALQDLFSENVSVDMKIQLVLFVQQQVDLLINDADSAEQVFGSLLNIYRYPGNHLILLKSEILVALTVIFIQFDLMDSHADFITMLCDIILRVNSGQPLIRKTSSECLCMLEEAYEGILCEQLQSFLATSIEERSFASNSHLILVGCIFNHAMQKMQSNKEADKVCSFDVSKCSLYLIKQMSTLSPTGLLQLVPKVLPYLEKSKIPKLVLGTLLMYSSQSWNLALIYVSVFMQNNYPSLFQQLDETWLMSVLMKLLMLKELQQLPYEQRQIVTYWIENYIQRLPNELKVPASLHAFPILEPTIYDCYDIFNSKLDCLAHITQHTSSKWSLTTQTNIFNGMVSHARHTKTCKETAVLFHGLYQLYKHGEGQFKEKILKLVEDLTVYTLRVVPSTIDFCDKINLDESSNVLLKSITQHLLRFNVKDILNNLKYYLSMIEKVALAPDICPMLIIEKLKHISRTAQMKNCSWKNGNLLLSVCKNILKTSKMPQVKYDVACLLWNISQSFHNNNLCDRALFTYLIIGNISPEYYENILLSSNHSCKTDEGGTNLIVTSNPSTSESSLLITPAKTNFLSFTLLPQSEELCRGNTLTVNATEDLLTAYHAAMKATEFDSDITHTFSLEFDDNVPDSPDKLFAIEVTITTSGPFEKIQGASCPYMFKKSLTENKTKGEVITVKFTPRKPQPSLFDVCVSYMDDDNKCCMVNLHPFQLKFEDLFKPLMVIEDKKDDELCLFDSLWKYLTQDEVSSNRKHTQSIHHLGNTPLEYITERLRQFVIARKDNQLYVGIFLPPSNHMLLIFIFDEGVTNVKIATDDYMLLDEINTFLEGLKT